MNEPGNEWMKMDPASPKPSDKSAAGAHHTPVLLAEVLAALAPKDGEIYIDGTFGAGGYAKALLEAADCTVWGLDRDPDAVSRGQGLADRYGGRLTVVQGRFSQMDSILAAHGVGAVDGVALDLGLSSDQLADRGGGFACPPGGPWDMRMDKEGDSAAGFGNRADAETLSDVIRRHGEERHARRIARAIVAARTERPITRTLHLAEVVAAAVPAARGRLHPATRTFQALRIHTNNELGEDGELALGLRAAERLLAPDGRIAVVSFHSLEDRVVKQFLNERSGHTGLRSRHLPPDTAGRRPPSFRLQFRGVQKPAEAETSANPRARSARLRAAVRTTAPAWRDTNRSCSVRSPSPPSVFSRSCPSRCSNSSPRSRDWKKHCAISTASSRPARGGVRCVSADGAS